MNKRLVAIIFLFFHFKGYCQFMDCDESIQMANNDFSNSVYKIYSFGRFSLGETYTKLLKKVYNINLIAKGCIALEGDQCYDSTMRILLTNKFGDEFMDSLYYEAEYLDSSGQGNRQAYFGDVTGRLYLNFIYCNLDITKTKMLSSDTLCAKVSFTIDETGLPMNFKILSGLDDMANNEILRVLKHLPHFVYATKDGVPVAEERTLVIGFNKKYKNIYCP